MERKAERQKVEDRVCTYQICIPHPDRVLHAYLAHEQTVHPSERELHELDVLSLEMRGKRRYDSTVSAEIMPMHR